MDEHESNDTRRRTIVHYIRYYDKLFIESDP